MVFREYLRSYSDIAKSKKADEGTTELNPSEDLLLDDPESGEEEKITASKLKDVSKKEMLSLIHI